MGHIPYIPDMDPRTYIYICVCVCVCVCIILINTKNISIRETNFYPYVMDE